MPGFRAQDRKTVTASTQHSKFDPGPECEGCRSHRSSTRMIVFLTLLNRFISASLVEV
jgi:hypothetical protein